MGRWVITHLRNNGDTAQPGYFSIFRVADVMQCYGQERKWYGMGEEVLQNTDPFGPNCRDYSTPSLCPQSLRVTGTTNEYYHKYHGGFKPQVCYRKRHHASYQPHQGTCKGCLQHLAAPFSGNLHDINCACMDFIPIYFQASVGGLQNSSSAVAPEPCQFILDRVFADVPLPDAKQIEDYRAWTCPP